MKVTRRQAFEALATAAAAVVAEQAAEQPANAQQGGGPVPLKWLGDETPALAAGVSWGVPFPRGTVAKAQTFGLTAADGRALPLQQWPLAYWPDGSMKFIGFASAVPANTSGEFRLAPGAPAPASLRVQQSAAAVEIDTGVLQCSIPKRGADFISSMKMEGREVARQGRLLCTLEDRSTPVRFDSMIS